MDQSNVVTDGQTVVVLVSEDLIGGDLQSSVLHSLPKNSVKVDTDDDKIRSDLTLWAPSITLTLLAKNIFFKF